MFYPNKVLKIVHLQTPNGPTGAPNSSKAPKEIRLSSLFFFCSIDSESSLKRLASQSPKPVSWADHDRISRGFMVWIESFWGTLMHFSSYHPPIHPSAFFVSNYIHGFRIFSPDSEVGVGICRALPSNRIEGSLWLEDEDLECHFA